MCDNHMPKYSFYSIAGFGLRSLIKFKFSRSGLLAVFAGAFLFSLPVYAQQDDSKNLPSVVQPGAPGQTTRKLPSGTKAILPPRSQKDVEFMQGMIHHHAQAVEMTALINERTKNKEIRLLGSRISQSQSDEMSMMKRWLETRGEKTSMTMTMKKTDKTNKMENMDMSGMAGMDMSSHHHDDQEMLMPGMLTAKQMEALRNAIGTEFDLLFLTGMIQHHEGALVMVDELFKTTGAGQEAQLFNFATDIDSSQRAEIRIMQTLLGEKP